MNVAVVGAGAAGCFCAIEIKRRAPKSKVTVFEAGPMPLAKLAITGGGRCNFTNSFAQILRLEEAYPRGSRLMKRALRTFSNEDTVKWFDREGVASVTQEDGCVFPKSQNAMQIVRTLEHLMDRLGVEVLCNRRIDNVSNLNEDIVVVCAGGHSAASIRKMIPEDIAVTETVPSLYTLKIEDDALRSLMGTVADNAVLSLSGTGYKARGALLITDWGISGPACLKLSSYAARHLSENGYRGGLLINWTGKGEEEVRSELAGKAVSNARKMVSSTIPEGLSSRLWKMLVGRSGIREDARWGELGSKSFSKLVNTITADSYCIGGKSRFREEFVTCGGVSLTEINLATMESKKHPGLFFAGEVLDIDAITGGFNLQAAWSTAFCAAQAICSEHLLFLHP